MTGKELSIPKALLGSASDVIELGVQDHNTNTMVTQWDWLRAKDLAEVRGCSVSDIVRTAIQSTFDSLPAAELEGLNGLAVARLEHQVAQNKLRQKLIDNR